MKKPYDVIIIGTGRAGPSLAVKWLAPGSASPSLSEAVLAEHV
jgi:pyruvate/2-oxoglutarate dehydrogenase complex dihydrolipoamide dehydrogenase (E3) component